MAMADAMMVRTVTILMRRPHPATRTARSTRALSPGLGSGLDRDPSIVKDRAVRDREPPDLGG